MKKMFVLTATALLALAACDKPAGTGGGTSTAAAVKPPPGGSWAEVTAKTPDGGMRMGNPDAAVKLVEYGALTCSHCAEFAEKGGAGLKPYIEKGTVSYEFRPFPLNVVDVPAFLLARCGGPGPFFPISDQMFAAQREWLGKTAGISPAEQQSWQSLPPEQLAAALAAKLGLDAFVQARGIGSAQAKACLADRKAIDELGSIAQRGQKEFNISSTPSFVINGRTLTDVHAWEPLEPEIKKAGG